MTLHINLAIVFIGKANKDIFDSDLFLLIRNLENERLKPSYEYKITF